MRKRTKSKKDQLMALLKEEETLLKHETIETKHIYQKLLELEELLKRRQLRKFNDVIAWRENIWENCKYKQERQKKREILYMCKKTKKMCHFVDCPENKA